MRNSAFTLLPKRLGKQTPFSFLNYVSTRILAIGAVFLVGTAVQAQVTNVTDIESTPIPGAGHDYLHMVDETVNPANGALSLRIQVPAPKSRGMTMPFAFAYDSNGALPLPQSGSSQYASGMGWSYTVPSVTSQHRSIKVTEPGDPGDPLICPYTTGYVFADADGTRHAFPQLATVTGGTSGDCALLGYGNNLTGGDAWYSATIPANANGVILGPPQIQDADGNTYIGGVVEDRNGNKTIYNLQSNGVFTVTDSAGRTSISSNGFGSTGNTITVSGLSNPYTINWGETATWDYTVLPVSTYVPSTATSCGTGAFPLPSTGSAAVISSIQLPNGQSYSFTYDSTYGLINKITYPTGAYVQYTWSYDPESEALFTEGTQANGTGISCGYRFGMPRISKREVSYNGQSIAEEQDFTYYTKWTDNGNDLTAVKWTYKNNKVTTFDLVVSPSRGKSYNTSYIYGPVNTGVYEFASSYVGSQVPVENSIVYQDWGSGTTLQTVVKTWTNQFLLTSAQTDLPNGNSKATYSYGTLGALKEKDEFGFGQSTASRKTINTFQTFATNPIGSSIYDRPCQTLVTDGSGNRISETDYFYDNGSAGTVCGTAGTPSVASVSSITGHDEVNFSASSTGPRGNATQQTRYLNTGISPTTTYTYDEAGQVLSQTDPCGNTTCSDMPGTSGHTTNYYYTDNYSSGTPTGVTDTYLTTITDPLGHSSNFAYSLNDGQVTSSEDPNSQFTYYKYNTPPSGCTLPDGLDRLSESDFPDGGKTTYCYNDAGPSPTVTATVYASPDPSIVTVTTLDGVGHTTRTQITSDTPAGADTVDTTYNGIGTVFSKTNPYRSPAAANDPPAGTTLFSYDALGRPTVQTQQDGTSKLQWCYNGIASGQSNCGANASSMTADSWVDVADEMGNDSQQVTDGLGRLVAVVEPLLSNQTKRGETDYTYDLLDDLATVTQNGLSGEVPRAARTFTYDSLSRLTQAFNPESGSTCYGAMMSSDGPPSCISGYDADGNLGSKTDARGTTIFYTYDALSRLKGKTYSDGTPSIALNYDEASVSWMSAGLSNTIGRLSSAYSQGANIYSRYSYSYDAMGRQTYKGFMNPDSTGATLASGVGSSSTLYDQAGHLTEITEGPGINLYLVRDGAGRTTQVTSNKNTTNLLNNVFSHTLFSGATYTPYGALSTRLLGNGLTETKTYDNRERVSSISQSQKGSAIQYTSSVTYQANSNLLTANDSVNGNWTYGYDSLNRLSTASSAAGLNLSWVYDSFGNRWSQTATGTGSAPQPTFTFSQNNNRADGLTYDPAGNTTIDNLGQTYTYDAEGRISSVAGGPGSATYEYDSEGQLLFENGSNGIQIFQRNASGQPTFIYNPSTGNSPPYYIFGAFIDGDQVGSWQTNSATFNWDGKDWLGTKRYETGGLGDGATATPRLPVPYTSLPFGDALSSIGNDPTHFTGKERDAESGLDYFGARYYGSSMGRFMSPDWSEEPAPLYYANLENPQSLNLYAYVNNNPLSHTDPDGHIMLNPDCPCNIDYGFLWRDLIRRTNAMTDWELSTLRNFFGKNKTVVPPVVTPAQTANPNPDDKKDPQKKTSRNQMQKQVEKGKAPKSVDRVDPGLGPNEQDHIHFSDGNALNEDGTWKHGGRSLTNAESEWIQSNGWSTPK
jgi:RHS repeat-associated protein